MIVQPTDYEELLASYSDRATAIELLKQHRPYLELLPSMRRPLESAIAIPLPIVRVEANSLQVLTLADLSDRRLQIDPIDTTGYGIRASRLAVRLPCDVALLMCDPEWQVTTGAEIFLFLHRPREDFYHLLSRWRQTQILLDREYEWVLPGQFGQVSGESTGKIYPLFVTLPETPDRVLRGLTGAHLPYVVGRSASSQVDAAAESVGLETGSDLDQGGQGDRSSDGLVEACPDQLHPDQPHSDDLVDPLFLDSVLDQAKEPYWGDQDIGNHPNQ